MNGTQLQIHALNKDMEKSDPSNITNLISQATNLDATLGNYLTNYINNYPSKLADKKESFTLSATKAIDKRLFELGVPQNHYELQNDGCEPKPFSNIWILKIRQYLQ